MRILRIARHVRNNAWPRFVARFNAHGLSIYGALGVRERGELQHSVKKRHIGVRVVQIQRVNASTLRGRGLLNRTRNPRPNSRTFRVTLEQVRNLMGAVGWIMGHAPKQQ